MVRVLKPESGVFFRNLLNGDRYTSRKFYECERERIFDRSWIFAGAVAQIPNERDFFVLNFFDWSIIVGRYGGEIRAFENRCPHRSSPIQLCSSGNRDLKCPFHGWTFRADGCVHGIPYQKDHFDFSEKERAEIKLKSFPVENINGLIFLRMPGCRQSLNQFLGGAREALSVYASKWTTWSSWETNRIGANWKIYVEIALEAYHASEVHSTSLGAPQNITSEYYNLISFKGGHQIINIGNHSLPNRTAMATTIFFVFPNSFFIQIDGTLSLVLQLWPRGENETELHSFVYFPHDARPKFAPFRALTRALRQTNAEDGVICEGIQSVIQVQKKGQPLASVEKGVYQFQRDYLRKMSRSLFSFFMA